MFIVFEGGEFVGKTSQIRMLAARLEERGASVVITKEPGGTPRGEELRARLLAGGLAPEDEVALFIEGRRIHVSDVLKPALREGKIVLCDRFSDSTIAYQHFGRGIDRTFLEREDAAARDGIVPDLVILLDMPPERAFERAGKRGEVLTSFEREKIDFHKKVRAGFLELAEQNSHNHVIVNADDSKEHVAEEVWGIVSKRVFV